MPVPLEQTLARITPHFAANGITRCMPITQLDDLGVPTCCAIRPAGLALQVSNGKGVSDAAARVSAAMEALELTHAERPLPERLRRTSLAALRAAGEDALHPREIHGFRDRYYSEGFVCDWVQGKNLLDGAPVWAPASAVYFYSTPSLHETSSNGMAGGNSLAEAMLQAIYELVERDAMSRLSVDGSLRIRDRALVIDPLTISDTVVRGLLDRIERAGTKALLLWLPSAIGVHTFWSATLHGDPLASVSTLNVGWGTHADAGIAARRAITEAAQSRLTFIHGAREDIQLKGVAQVDNARESEAVRYFDALQPDAAWDDALRRATVAHDDNPEAMLRRIVEELASAGHPRLIGFDLTNPAYDIPVVKVIAPSLLFNHSLF